MRSEHMKSEKAKGVAALLLMSCIGASMGLFARWLKEDMALFQQVFFRILAGLLFGFVIFYRQLDLGKLRALPAREWGLLLIRSSTLYLLGITFGTKAYVTAKYSNVAFIMAMPATALIGILFFREKATARKVLLLVTSLAGAMLLVVKDYNALLVREVGEIYALMAVVVFSFGIVARKWHGTLLNDRELTQLLILIAAFELLIASLVTGESIETIRWSTTTVAVVCVAGLFNVLYMLLANYGFHKVDAVLGNNILATQPIFALLLGFLLFSDVPSPVELFGSLILMMRLPPAPKLAVGASRS